MKINRFNESNGSKPMDMKIVESLTEDEDTVVDETTLTVSSIVSDLIRKEWDAVDMVNAYLITSQQYDCPELVSTLTSFLDDHYVHIGQLEGILQAQVPEANQIDSSRDDSEDVEEIVDVEEF